MRRLLLFLLTVMLCGAADSTAILPFANESGNPSLNWIGESIAESIQESLASEGLIVLNREDRNEAYRRLALRPYAKITRASVIKIGEALDADKLIYGQFVVVAADAANPQSKQTIRMSMRMLDVKSFRQGGEISASGNLEELGTLQNRLAFQAVKLVVEGSEVSEAAFTAKHTPVRLDALEAYIRGLLATTTEQKHKFFTSAARLDAKYGQPAFQLGRLHFDAKNWRTAADWLGRVTPEVPRYREAMFLLGICQYNTADYEGARKTFQIVADAVPINEVLNNLGAAQSRSNDPKAVESFRKALEGDEADPVYHFNLGYALWKNGKYDEAADAFRATLERVPEDADATVMLGRSIKKIGPRAGDPRSEGRERLKYEYEETVYWQLKSMLEKK